MKLKSIVPPMYERYFPKSLWNFDIQETKATCDRCIRAPDTYDENLKCCTFWPFIPNYIVGQILASSEVKYKTVQDLIRTRIKEKHWVLPIGLVAPSSYQVDFLKNKAQVFGRKRSFLCPYYSKATNSCGMWIYRGSVCTSFFCESSYGKKGHTFWQKFENYFSYLEMGISQEILAYKDYSPRDVTAQLEYLMVQKKVRFNSGKYQKIWKHFYNQEEEFYRQSAQFAVAMPTSQIEEILGETGEDIRSDLVSAHRRLLR